MVADSNGNLYTTFTELVGASTYDDGIMEIVAGTNAVVQIDGTGQFAPNAFGSSFAASNATLLSDGKGGLYGTTANGGSHSNGELFSIAASTHAVSAIYNFAAGSGAPNSGLVQGRDGYLYGTIAASASDSGQVYKVSSSGADYTSLYTFTRTGSSDSEPVGGLIVDAVGDLFGVTIVGGAFNHGTVFELYDQGPSLAGDTFGYIDLLDFNEPIMAACRSPA